MSLYLQLSLVLHVKQNGSTMSTFIASSFLFCICVCLRVAAIPLLVTLDFVSPYSVFHISIYRNGWCVFVCVSVCVCFPFVWLKTKVENAPEKEKPKSNTVFQHIITHHKQPSLSGFTFRSNWWLHGGTGCIRAAAASEGGTAAEPRARAAGEAL